MSEDEPFYFGIKKMFYTDFTACTLHQVSLIPYLQIEGYGKGDLKTLQWQKK